MRVVGNVEHRGKQDAFLRSDVTTTVAWVEFVGNGESFEWALGTL